jgi:hypothetical protein
MRKSSGGSRDGGKEKGEAVREGDMEGTANEVGQEGNRGERG